MNYDINFSYENINYQMRLDEAPSDEGVITINGKSYHVTLFEEPPILQSFLNSLNGQSFDSVETFEATLAEFDTEEKVTACYEKYLSAEKLDEDKEENLNIFFQKNVEKTSFRGSVLIAYKNKILLHKGYGVANELGEEVSTETIFHLGSISKQFTAAAILLLEQEKKLSTNDLIKIHLPENLYSNIWDKITIHELLNHSSGLTDFPQEYYQIAEPKTPEMLIKEFQSSPLLFAPGTAWKYSDPGYILLGVIIEKVSAETYGDFIKNHIFTACCMENSGYGDSYNIKKAAVGYLQSPSLKPIKDQEKYLINAYAAGGLYSTTEDLLKWIKALHTEKILTEESKQKAFYFSNLPLHLPVEPSYPIDESTFPYPFQQEKKPIIHYGYGVFLWQSPKLGLCTYHFGSIPGFTSVVARYLQTGNYVIILSNQENAPLKEFLDYIDSIFNLT